MQCMTNTGHVTCDLYRHMLFISHQILLYTDCFKPAQEDKESCSGLEFTVEIQKTTFFCLFIKPSHMHRSPLSSPDHHIKFSLDTHQSFSKPLVVRNFELLLNLF